MRNLLVLPIVALMSAEVSAVVFVNASIFSVHRAIMTSPVSGVVNMEINETVGLAGATRMTELLLATDRYRYAHRFETQLAFDGPEDATISYDRMLSVAPGPGLAGTIAADGAEVQYRFSTPVPIAYRLDYSVSIGSGGSLTFESNLPFGGTGFAFFYDTPFSTFAGVAEGMLGPGAFSLAVLDANLPLSLGSVLGQSVVASFRLRLGDAIPIKPAPPVGHIPEPATWAMLLAGFGLVGWAVRRRTGVTVRRAGEHG